MYGNSPKKKSYFITLIKSGLFQLFLSNLINIQFVGRREKPCFSTTNESFLVEFRCVPRREKRRLYNTLVNSSLRKPEIVISIYFQNSSFIYQR